MFALMLVLVAPAAAAQDLIPLKQRVLDNGVTVLVWERPSAGRVGFVTDPFSADTDLDPFNDDKDSCPTVANEDPHLDQSSDAFFNKKRVPLGALDQQPSEPSKTVVIPEQTAE